MDNRRLNTWTLEDDTLLLQLRNVHKRKWVDIGAEMYRSKTSVQARYCQLTPQKLRIRLFRRPSWTTEAEAEVLDMRFTQGLKIADIARKTGRTPHAVADKLERLKNGPGEKVHFERQAKRFVPQEVLDDRERRMNAERSLSAELCGEPRPGQSALDRKRQEGARVDRRSGPKPTLAGELA